MWHSSETRILSVLRTKTCLDTIMTEKHVNVDRSVLKWSLTPFQNLTRFVSLLLSITLVTLSCTETGNRNMGDTAGLMSRVQTIPFSNHCWNTAVSTNNCEKRLWWYLWMHVVPTFGCFICVFILSVWKCVPLEVRELGLTPTKPIYLYNVRKLAFRMSWRLQGTSSGLFKAQRDHDESLLSKDSIQELSSELFCFFAQSNT